MLELVEYLNLVEVHEYLDKKSTFSFYLFNYSWGGGVGEGLGFSLINLFQIVIYVTVPNNAHQSTISTRPASIKGKPYSQETYIYIYIYRA